MPFWPGLPDPFPAEIAALPINAAAAPHIGIRMVNSMASVRYLLVMSGAS